MNTLYTLVSYRPNGEQSCRGHVTERSDSDFDIDTSDNPGDISLAWGKKLYEDHMRRQYSAVRKWEFTLMINGDSYGSWSHDEEGNDVHSEIREQIEKNAYVALNTLIAENKLQKEAEAKQAADALAAANARTALEREQRELADYQRLKKKFEHMDPMAENS